MDAALVERQSQGRRATKTAKQRKKSSAVTASGYCAE